jgi:simple sugar transport system ATP-binding protein
VKTPQADQPVLQLTGVGKQFGAIRALHAVDMHVSSGEVVGLMGDNGAGKSTLVKKTG